MCQSHINETSHACNGKALTHQRKQIGLCPISTKVIQGIKHPTPSHSTSIPWDGRNLPGCAVLLGSSSIGAIGTALVGFGDAPRGGATEK